MAGNTSQTHVYMWWSSDGTTMIPVTLSDPFPVNVVSGGIGSNASVGLTGSTAPTSATEIGWVDGSGNLTSVSAANPLPITGSISASNPSVSSTGAAVPASGTYVGMNVSGNLTGLTGTANGLKVDGSAVTQPVSAASLPLPSGAATSALQSTINTTLGSPFQAGGSIGNTSFGATQSGTWNITNISGTVSLPTGAATSAKQPALGTAGTPSSDVLTVQGAASMTALKVDGSATTQPVSGTVTANQGGVWTVQPGNTANTTAWKVDGSAVTQPVSGTITANAGTNLNTSALALESGGNLATLAGGVTSSVYQHNIKQVNGITVLTGTGATGTGSQRVTVATDSATVAGSATIPAGTNVIGKVGIDQTTPGTTNLVSAGQSGTWNIGTVTTVTGITSAFGATATSVPANVGYTGLRGTTANPTAVTDGQSVGSMGDKVGRQAVVPYAVRDLVAQQKTTITNTGETTIVTAIASTFCDILSFNFSNTGATSTAVHIRDTTAGTVVASFMVPAGDMRGQTYTIPFKQTTVNTNWTATCVSATTSMEITVQYVKNI